MAESSARPIVRCFAKIRSCDLLAVFAALAASQYMLIKTIFGNPKLHYVSNVTVHTTNLALTPDIFHVFGFNTGKELYADTHTDKGTKK